MPMIVTTLNLVLEARELEWEVLQYRVRETIIMISKKISSGATCSQKLVHYAFRLLKAMSMIVTTLNFGLKAWVERSLCIVEWFESGCLGIYHFRPTQLSNIDRNLCSGSFWGFVALLLAKVLYDCLFDIRTFCFLVEWRWRCGHGWIERRKLHSESESLVWWCWSWNNVQVRKKLLR